METSHDDDGRWISRRGALATIGGLAGVGTVAGYLDAGGESVRVLSAGSLATTFEDHVAPAFEAQTGIGVHGEYYGANAVMRMVEDGTKHPDVVVSADATLLRDRLYDGVTDWDVEFASNAVGIAYAPDVPLGRRLADGEPWYAVARDADPGEIAIGDPDLDPLGYRAVQAFELAEHEHDLDGFRDAMLDRVYREPDEPQLLAGVEAGSRAAAVVYRNMAVDHDVPFRTFPAAYSFADPGLADQYATVTYTTDEEGYTARGRPVLYNATVIDRADAPEAGHRLVRFLADSPDLLRDAGLTVSNELPRANGSVPPPVER